MPNVGDAAPDFELISTEGETIKLSSLQGQKVVLYFYPKDDTPGCTKEACDLRDNYTEIKKFAVILGVSADDNTSHKKFAEKHSIPFPLLSDSDKKVCTDYGVWVQKSMFGKKYMGIQRATFLIDEKGKIAKIWPKVNVLSHVNDVIKAINS